MATLSDLISELTQEDIYDELIDRLRDKEVPVTAWQPGEPMDAFAQVVAEFVRDKWNRFVVPAAKAAFLDESTGAWLTILAWAVYGVQRRTVSYAEGTLRVINSGLVPWNISAGDIVIKNTLTKKTYFNIGSGYLSSIDAPPNYLDLVFRAEEAGSASDSIPANITTTPVQGPASVTVSTAAPNNTPLVGADAESDKSLRNRCRLSSAISPVYYSDGSKKEYSFGGPNSAYEYISLSTVRSDGVTPVAVNRVRVASPGGGDVEVWLAGPSGPAEGDWLTVDTDVFLVYAALLAKVNTTGLSLYVAPCGTVPVFPIFHVTVDRESLVTKAEAEAAVTSAMLDYFANFKIGGTRVTPAVSSTESGYLFASEMIAKASESIKGIVHVQCYNGDDPGLASFDAATEISYNEVAVLSDMVVVATVVTQ